MLGQLQEHDLPGVLEELARGRAHHTAFVDGEVRLTYRDVRARVHRLANALEAMGLGRGDRILYLTQNTYRIVEGVLAAALLGAMICPVNWRQSAEELAFVIDDFSPKLVFWQEEEIGDAVRDARALAKTRAKAWLRHGGSGDDYETLLENADAKAKTRAIDPSLPVLVVYTAAFAGVPNGAMLNQTAILTQRDRKSVV